MKRQLTPVNGDMKMKKLKQQLDDEDKANKKTESMHLLDDNLLFEVLKHVDARTLGRAGCVNRQWHQTGLDERLWELICGKQLPNIGCGDQQLRSVVLALGGFRKLHSLYLWPLSSKPESSSSSTIMLPAALIGSKAPAARWGKDEVNLSLSLLSIGYFYEKMNFGKRKNL